MSKASSTPVMPEVGIRACHVHGSFITKYNRKPPFSLTQARNAPQRDTSRIVPPPATIDYIRTHDLNEVFDGDLYDIGIILGGGLYNGVMRAGLADIWGATRVPLYVLNVIYPLVDPDVVAFCRDKRAVLVVEESQPDFIDQALSKIPRNAESPTGLTGDRAWMGLSGRLPLSLKHANEKLHDDPLTAIDPSCVGCGHRRKIATAAMLWVRRPGEAALKDEAGHALDNPLKAVASFPNERAAA